MESTSQPKKAIREALLEQLVRKRKEHQLQQEIEALSEKNPEFRKGMAHNQFGCACMKANMTQKAENCLKIAHQLVSPIVLFTNVFMNLGNLYAQMKDYKKAIEYYQKVVKESPFSKEQPYEGDNKQLVFSPKLNSYSAFVDAHTNLAVMYSQTQQGEKGFEYCKKALEMHPDGTAAQINFGDIMRQLGKKDEAIEYTWRQIEKYTQKKRQDYTRAKWIEIPETEQKTNEADKIINILCVKWGKRYGADYVNKIYAGIARNTSWKFKFFCFTEDGSGLLEQIQVMPLEEGWTGWWGKVTLFKEYPEIKGRKFYIDLDMIITGNLDDLFSYSGTFSTLKTDEIACEKAREKGYNSSVMIWQDDSLLPIYQALKDNFENINKFIVRFDFWLQMNIRNSDFLQDQFPGQIQDFVMSCQKQLPGGTRIVCFPRKPKPEDYPAEWIKQAWVL